MRADSRYLVRSAVLEIRSMEKKKHYIQTYTGVRVHCITIQWNKGYHCLKNAYGELEMLIESHEHFSTIGQLRSPVLLSEYLWL